MNLLSCDLPNTVLEILGEHLYGDPDLGSDDYDVEAYDVSNLGIDEIRAIWKESIRDLSHLTRAERTNVLRNRSEPRPYIVDDIELVLFTGVQREKGDARITAAVIVRGGVKLLVYGI